MFPETREDIGYIRATTANFEKSPAVKAGRAALGEAKKLAIANQKIIDAATERLNKRIPEAQKNYAIAVKEAIAEANADLRAQADPNAGSAGLTKRHAKAQVRDFDGDPSRITEMDALIAYLQMLGTLVDHKKAAAQQVRNAEMAK
jgi:cbb3-type cytochrome oxidase cytochrome c subunit